MSKPYTGFDFVSILSARTTRPLLTYLHWERMLKL